MFEKLGRDYKTISAEKTVANIMGILDQLGFRTRPIHQLNPYEGIYSLSIFLEGIGTTSHGKGLNAAFALASGYAEFMERIQSTPILFLTADRFQPHQRLYEKFGWSFYPDEKEIRIADFENTVQAIIEDNFQNEKGPKENFQIAADLYKSNLKNGRPQAIAVPFFDAKHKRSIYLPLEFIYNLCGTTGMCAGNDPAEALCQGLFEIIERYAAQKIYFEQLTPPDVPDAYLSDYPGELAIIREIMKKEGLEVSIKDFSCGMRLPAVGVVLKNLKKNTYHVHCGAETSFAVGLHRCLTETYQNAYDLNARMRYHIPETELSFMLEKDEDSIYQKYKNYLDWLHHGGGAFPKSVLGANASYGFDGTVFKTEANYDLELRKLVRFFWSLGKNVYIRNNSYLGFPAFWIYIPEISHEADSVIGQYTYYSKLRVTNLGKILKEKNDPKLRELIHELQCQPPHEPLSTHYYYMSIKVSEKTNLFENLTTYLLAMLYYYFKDYRRCLVLLQEIYEYYHLKKQEKGAEFMRFHELFYDQTEEYFNILMDYVKNRLNGNAEAAKQSLTGKQYNPVLIDKADGLLKESSNLLDAVNLFPKCPECTACKLNVYCGTKNSIPMLEVVYSAMQTRKPIPFESGLLNEKDSHETVARTFKMEYKI